MSLPRPLEYNNQHTLNLSESCPVQSDHLTPQGQVTVTLQVGSLSAASYILIAMDTKGQTHSRKLIKQ